MDTIFMTFNFKEKVHEVQFLKICIMKLVLAYKEEHIFTSQGRFFKVIEKKVSHIFEAESIESASFKE